MTEQQFEKLKTMLQSSDAPENSPELDSSILGAAKQQAEQYQQSEKRTSSKNNSTNWFVSLLQGSYAQAAVLSVALTLAVFFGLGQMLKPDSDDLFAHTNGQKDHTEITFVVPQKSSVLTHQTPLIPDALPEPLITDAREQILAQMNTLNVGELLDSMNFDQQKDRQFAESLVILAMTDIQFMLKNGKLNNARQRYVELKERCDVCRLPNTLDALALQFFKRSDQT